MGDSVEVEFAINKLRMFLSEEYAVLETANLKEYIQVVLDDYAYWKDRSYDFQPVTPSDPVNGMSAFDREFTMQPDTRSKKTKIKDLAVAVAVLQDRVTKLEK